jgi:lipid-A-disaccharide synthase
MSSEARPLRVFVVAGEHSGDRLGAKLMAALRRLHPARVDFAGIGGEDMEAEGLASLFPISEIAVMGPAAILRRLRPIIRRAHQTIDAAIAFNPDVVVVIDAPEFNLRVAERIRRRRPDIPIVDYVSPTVWAWRPGRARAMQPHVDHLLALLPFEPKAHAELGGPACSYVGHPLTERLVEIRAMETDSLRQRVGLREGDVPIVVLPGSRRSEVTRLIGAFGEAVGLLASREPSLVVLMPVVPSVRALVEESVARWPLKPILIEGDADKWRAFRLARAALAASGTVTLELAVAGVPMVVAYKVEPWIAPVLRRMIKVPTVTLPNLVLGENAFPERIQEQCTPAELAELMQTLLDDTPARAAQIAALASIPEALELPPGNATPSDAAARIVLGYAASGRRVS